MKTLKQFITESKARLAVGDYVKVFDGQKCFYKYTPKKYQKFLDKVGKVLSIHPQSQSSTKLRILFDGGEEGVIANIFLHGPYKTPEEANEFVEPTLETVASLDFIKTLNEMKEFTSNAPFHFDWHVEHKYQYYNAGFQVVVAKSKFQNNITVKYNYKSKKLTLDAEILIKDIYAYYNNQVNVIFYNASSVSSVSSFFKQLYVPFESYCYAIEYLNTLTPLDKFDEQGFNKFVIHKQRIKTLSYDDEMPDVTDIFD